MNEQNRFTVEKLSDAGWLEGVKKVRCIDITFDPRDDRRLVFVFDINPEEGKKLVLEFGSSEASAFDNSIKRMKGLMAGMLRRGDR